MSDQKEFLAKANEFLNNKMEAFKRRQEEDLNTLLESWKLYCVKALSEERAKLVKEFRENKKSKEEKQNNKQHEEEQQQQPAPTTTTTTSEAPAKPKQQPQREPKKDATPKTERAPKQQQQPANNANKPSSAPRNTQPKEKATPEKPLVPITLVLPEGQYASELATVESVSASILAKKPSVVVFTSLWNKRYGVPASDKADLASFIIANEEHVNVLHMAQCSFMPKALTELLMSNEIIKVGFNIHKDYDKLFKEFNQLYMVGAVELNTNNKYRNIFEMGKHLVPAAVASEWYNSDAKNSDWGQVELSQEQITYAYQLGHLTLNILKAQHAQQADKYPDMYNWVLKTRNPQF